MIDIPTVIGKGRVHLTTLAATWFICLSLVVSCDSSGDSDDSKEHLKSYCIRECVAETADSEICDTRCKCAVEKLASTLSAEDLSELADGIEAEEKGGGQELSKLRGAFQACKEEN